MKFRHYLESISDIGIYPLSSLLIFFLFFTALTIWAIKANKEYIDEIKNIPIDNGND